VDLAATQARASSLPHCRLIWVADLVPDTAAPTIEAMMEQGAAVVKRTLDGWPLKIMNVIDS